MAAAVAQNVEELGSALAPLAAPALLTDESSLICADVLAPEKGDLENANNDTSPLLDKNKEAMATVLNMSNDEKRELLKSVVCRHYLKGNCFKGSRCRFKHPVDPTDEASACVNENPDLSKGKSSLPRPSKTKKNSKQSTTTLSATPAGGMVNNGKPASTTKKATAPMLHNNSQAAQQMSDMFGQFSGPLGGNNQNNMNNGATTIPSWMRMRAADNYMTYDNLHGLGPATAGAPAPPPRGNGNSWANTSSSTAPANFYDGFSSSQNDHNWNITGSISAPPMGSSTTAAGLHRHNVTISQGPTTTKSKKHQQNINSHQRINLDVEQPTTNTSNATINTRTGTGSSSDQPGSSSSNTAGQSNGYVAGGSSSSTSGNNNHQSTSSKIRSKTVKNAALPPRKPPGLGFSRDVTREMENGSTNSPTNGSLVNNLSTETTTNANTSTGNVTTTSSFGAARAFREDFSPNSRLRDDTIINNSWNNRNANRQYYSPVRANHVEDQRGNNSNGLSPTGAASGGVGAATFNNRDQHSAGTNDTGSTFFHTSASLLQSQFHPVGPTSYLDLQHDSYNPLYGNTHSGFGPLAASTSNPMLSSSGAAGAAPGFIPGAGNHGYGNYGSSSVYDQFAPFGGHHGQGTAAGGGPAHNYNDLNSGAATMGSNTNTLASNQYSGYNLASLSNASSTGNFAYNQLEHQQGGRNSSGAAPLHPHEPNAAGSSSSLRRQQYADTLSSHTNLRHLPSSLPEDPQSQQLVLSLVTELLGVLQRQQHPDANGNVRRPLSPGATLMYADSAQLAAANGERGAMETYYTRRSQSRQYTADTYEDGFSTPEELFHTSSQLR